MIKNYKLSLVVLIVSCSLLNAMDETSLSDVIEIQPKKLKPLNGIKVAIVFKELCYLSPKSLSTYHVDYSWFKSQNYKEVNDLKFKRECDKYRFSFHVPNWNYEHAGFKSTDEEISKLGIFVHGPIEARCFIREKKREEFEKKMCELEKKQKNIEAKIKKVVGIEKYKNVKKNPELGFLSIKRVSQIQKDELSKIEAIAKVGLYKRLNWSKLYKFRKPNGERYLDKIFNHVQEKK